jgi:hypothetical protein
MKNLAYTINADDGRTTREGVANTDIVVKLQTRDRLVEVTLDKNNEVMVRVYAGQASLNYGFNDTSLLREYTINSDGTLDYEYVNPCVTDEIGDAVGVSTRPPFE